jgi:hypothetical protein
LRNVARFSFRGVAEYGKELGLRDSEIDGVVFDVERYKNGKFS